MAEEQNALVTPNIEDLMSRVDSRFTLVTLASRRARQINSYFNQLGEGIGKAIPPQVSTTARKPLSIAFEEIAEGKIGYERIDPGELVPEADQSDGADPVLSVLEGDKK